MRYLFDKAQQNPPLATANFTSKCEALRVGMGCSIATKVSHH
jgi:hypothetical protein